jgi:peptidoglycan/LPS O-acetylase OafA/YrhL
VTQVRSPRSLLVPKNEGPRVPNNFDLIRIAMAMLVVWSHSFALYRGSESAEPISLITREAINSGKVGVYVFFMVSGFLITQSFDRSSGSWSFLKKRIARIYPGFLVATSICAFVIVPLYAKTLTYTFGSVAKELGLRLLLRTDIADHGAFADNLVSGVNGSLWSIPYEFWCYLGVLGVGLVGLLKLRRRTFLLCVFIVLALGRGWLEITGKRPSLGLVRVIIGFPYEWFRVLPCFLAGTLVYLYRDELPRRLWIAILGPLILIAATNLPIAMPWKMALVGLIFPPAIAYAMFYFAFTTQLFNAARYGDFSYGAYLYAFPIQQMMLASFGTAIPFWLYIPLAMLLALAAGVLSWHGVERWFNASVKKREPTHVKAIPNSSRSL